MRLDTCDCGDISISRMKVIEEIERVIGYYEAANVPDLKPINNISTQENIRECINTQHLTVWQFCTFVSDDAQLN